MHPTAPCHTYKVIEIFLFDWLCYASNFNVMNYSKSTFRSYFIGIKSFPISKRLYSSNIKKKELEFDFF